MQQLNPSEISELIRSKIQNLSLSADVRTQGTVVTVTDGICRVHGLSDVMQGEMLEFPNNTFGLALKPRARLGRRGDPRRIRGTSRGRHGQVHQPPFWRCRWAPSFSGAW